MARTRLLRKWLKVLFVSLCALFILIVISTQIEQRIFRHRAELLLTEIRSIELRKTHWYEVRSQFERWYGQTDFDGPCDESTCKLQITISDSVLGFVSHANLFVRLDDYLRWRLKLSYDQGPFVSVAAFLFRTYVRMGGHPSRVSAAIGVQDGIVWSKNFSVVIETYGPATADSLNVWQGEYSLIATVDSVPRFSRFFDYEINPQLAIHPEYVIGAPGGCEICVFGWVEFTPYLDRAETDRLMTIDLSCLTRWHSCFTQIDLMPAAWSQYLAERPRVEALRRHVDCSPQTIEILGRDSLYITTGEIVQLRKNMRGAEDSKVTAKVRALEHVKGDSDLKVDEIREFPLSSRMDLIDPGISVGQKLIFFGRWKQVDELQIGDRRDCPVVTANDTNLRLVRNGMSRDSSIPEKTH
jgi:hypothetical protein